MEAIVIPALDQEAAARVRAGWKNIAKCGRSLGKLEEMVEQYAAMTGGVPEKLRSAAKRYLDLEKASFTAVGSVLKKEEYEQIINQRKM